MIQHLEMILVITANMRPLVTWRLAQNVTIGIDRCEKFVLASSTLMISMRMVVDQ